MPTQIEVKIRCYGRFRRGRLLEVDFDEHMVKVRLLSWELPQNVSADFNPEMHVHFHTLRAEDLKCLIKLQKGELNARDYYARENR